MPEPYDVLFLYAPPWAGPTRFSKHHLARLFAAAGSRVLYVEAPLTLLGLRRGRAFGRELAAALRPPRQVAERLWTRRHLLLVPYHAVSPLTSRRAANRLGQLQLGPAVRKDLARLGFERPLVIAGLPHAVDVVNSIDRRCLVYHCADDYAHVRGFPSSLPRLEADLCQRANLVITTSKTLCEDRLQYNPHTYWIPNGADIAHFSSSVAPAAELQGLPEPIVGFVGGLSQWVDVPLIAYLAAHRPSWTVVLIGPVGIDVSALAGLRNVRVLGPRPYADLPAYLAAMDVGLIPFRAEPVTYHADPIKAYEYLAAGLPVVATDLPALRRLEHVVRLADTPGEFLAQIDAALAEGRAARSAERQAEARRHGWSDRFGQIEHLIEATCPR